MHDSDGVSVITIKSRTDNNEEEKIIRKKNYSKKLIVAELMEDMLSVKFSCYQRDNQIMYLKETSNIIINKSTRKH